MYVTVSGIGKSSSYTRTLASGPVNPCVNAIVIATVRLSRFSFDFLVSLFPLAFCLLPPPLEVSLVFSFLV